MSNELPAAVQTDEHVFVPSARWLVGLCGTLLVALTAVLSYVWTSSQADRKAETTRTESRLDKHDEAILQLQLKQATCCQTGAIKSPP